MVHQWKTLVNTALPLYKLIYMGHNYLKKFDKIWGGVGPGEAADSRVWFRTPHPG